MQRRLVLSDFQENGDIQAQIRDMAKLTLLSNRLNEIQEKNLKMYPFVFFNDVKSAIMDYDLAKVDDNGGVRAGEHHVTYRIEVPRDAQDNVEKRCKALENGVRLWLWNDLKVVVYLNNLKVYESKDEREQPTSKKS
jgi:hypothetical protein